MTAKIQILDLLQDDAGKMHLGIGYTDVSGDQRHLIVPRAFILEPRRIVLRLLDEGAQLRREDAVADVQAAIDNAPKAPTGLLVTRHGWHGEVYVTSNEVIGDSSLPVFYVPLIDDDPAFGASGGTLEDWHGGLREPFAESSFLTFAASMAFGAILLEPLGAEGGTFSLVGETTTFKTTTARVSQSVFGRAEPNDLASLDVTKRGREELCASRCDSVLVGGRNSSPRKELFVRRRAGTRPLHRERARKNSLRQRREEQSARQRHLAGFCSADLGAPLRNKGSQARRRAPLGADSGVRRESRRRLRPHGFTRQRSPGASA